MVVRRKKQDDGFAQILVKALVDVVDGDSESVHVLEDFQDLPPVKEWVPCKLMDFSRILSKWRGWPIGRAVELFGNEKTGKSALALMAAEQCINDGGYVLWLDAEHSLNPEHMQRMKRTGRFFAVQPDHMEQCWDAIWVFLKKMQENGGFGLIVWDSIAMTPTKSELEGKAEMATQARVMSINVRRGRKRLARSRCAAIFINQVRSKIGGMSYGDNLVRPCGKAMDFMCDVMIKNTIVKTDSVGSGDDAEANGYLIKSQADKSRFSRPRAKTIWYLSFDVGPDAATTALMHLKKEKVIRAAGKALVFKVKGQEEVKLLNKLWPTYFEENQETINELLRSLADKNVKESNVEDDSTDEDEDTTDASRPRAPEPTDDE